MRAIIFGLHLNRTPLVSLKFTHHWLSFGFMRTTGSQAKQERKKQRSYIVQVEPAEFSVNASSRAEAIKEAKKVILKGGLDIYLDFGDKGVEWDILQDLAGLFSG